MLTNQKCWLNRETSFPNVREHDSVPQKVGADRCCSCPASRRRPIFVNRQLPALIERELNAHVEEYRFTVVQVTHSSLLSLEIRRLTMIQTEHPDPPVVEIPRWRLSIQWRHISAGVLVSDYVISRPTPTSPCRRRSRNFKTTFRSTRKDGERPSIRFIPSRFSGNRELVASRTQSWFTKYPECVKLHRPRTMYMRKLDYNYGRPHRRNASGYMGEQGAIAIVSRRRVISSAVSKSVCGMERLDRIIN
jgi:hypothetical protein